MRIGIDFDNTIAGYDALFVSLAEEQGLFARAPAGKTELRDALRRRPDGEMAWRRLQAMAYGPRMAAAALLDGADDFIRACHADGHRVRIVSHKTRFANYASDGTDLRQAATAWLDEQGFFDAGDLGLRPDDVFFEDTRAAKVDRIHDLGCDWFIDDLPEVFAEPGYPAATRAVLYDPHATAAADAAILHCRHWHEIGEHLLGAAH
ncbi:MAG: hypothetical protein QF578_07845 [Alphaproteobacteria bacterium]|jgi:hypothetical protein|nr:hypothetical protein [Alphaproteobacteria bacterium]MDP6815018.1 hypothetical protein [Alphaproteobacteria bacterium]